MIAVEVSLGLTSDQDHSTGSRLGSWSMLEWRLVGRGLQNPQILAHDGRGGVLAINRVSSRELPEKWWLTGPNYGLATEHNSQAEAKATAQHWADTGERPDRTNPETRATGLSTSIITTVSRDRRTAPNATTRGGGGCRRPPGFSGRADESDPAFVTQQQRRSSDRTP